MVNSVIAVSSTMKESWVVGAVSLGLPVFRGRALVVDPMKSITSCAHGGRVVTLFVILSGLLKYLETTPLGNSQNSCTGPPWTIRARIYR
jgi:hypothetical protein